MAGWMMTRLTSMSNMGWLYNCIIWFYSFYWLLRPSSLILPAPNQEVKCVEEEERIDARADGHVCAIRIRAFWGEADMAT